MATSPRYKGVSQDKNTGLWVAKINIDGEQKYLGCFKTQRGAHEAYVDAFDEFMSDDDTRKNLCAAVVVLREYSMAKEKTLVSAMGISQFKARRIISILLDIDAIRKVVGGKTPFYEAKDNAIQVITLATTRAINKRIKHDDFYGGFKIVEKANIAGLGNKKLAELDKLLKGVRK